MLDKRAWFAYIGDMTATINFKPQPPPGYTPRKAITRHNVAAVHSHGVNMIRLAMLFTDDRPEDYFDHVVSGSVIPDREE